MSERSAASGARRSEAGTPVSLAFLGVSGEDAPPARSALLGPALAAGMVCGCREGWMVPLSAGDAAAARLRSVAFVDACHRHVCELRPAPGERIASQPATGSADALQAVRRDGWWECPTGPDRVLLVADGAQAPPPFSGPRAQAVDLSCSLGGLLIVGPLGRELIVRFCALDLRPERTPVGGWRPGSVARTPGYVLREAEQRHLLLFGWAYSQYVWDVVSDAASALGGGPVGLDDLEAGGDA